MKRDEILKKILHKIKTGRIDSKTNTFTDIQKLDFSANIKFDLIDEGKVILVHDVPIAKEMVQEYGDGFHYKTAKAIDGIFVEYSPISIHHPKKLFKDMTDDEKVELTIGYLIHGHTKDNKKYADLMLFVDKTPDEVIGSIKEQSSIDVSIGFDVEIDETPGEFNGKKYDRKQTGITLDHLAVLPNGIGRASFPDGVGIGADSKHTNEVKGMEEAIKVLKDQNNELTRKRDGLSSEVSKLNDELKKAKDENKKLSERMDKDRLKELENKEKKYDKAEEEKEKTEETETDEIKKELLKVRNDDKFKEYLDSQNLEQLRFLKDEMSAKRNTLPANRNDKKSNVEDEGLHPADKHMKDTFEKVNKGYKISGVL